MNLLTLGDRNYYSHFLSCTSGRPRILALSILCIDPALSALQSALQLGPAMRSGPLKLRCLPYSAPLLCFILLSLFIFNYSPLGGATLTPESSGLSADNNDILFVAALHNIIVILSVALSACMVEHFIYRFYLLINNVYPSIMALNYDLTSDSI